MTTLTCDQTFHLFFPAAKKKKMEHLIAGYDNVDDGDDDGDDDDCIGWASKLRV